ncbi:MAG: CCA tRNA nucleotidyltransferase [Elusimicrobia bacterium]|nr:CCA tRNA nucleotidyltransferase [Elusimicrobiota bacterium]
MLRLNPPKKLSPLRSFDGRLYLVGGWVRDRLLGVESKDFDFIVEGDDALYHEALSLLLKTFPPEPGSRREFAQFRTLRWDSPGGWRLDLARPRKETYPYPGALPVVSQAADIAEDLGRRDFAANAMAWGVSRPVAGRWVDRFNGAGDVRLKRLRILHDKSFEDDPTRLLRAWRLMPRLGFCFDESTDQLARQAVAGGLLERVSWERRRDELLRAFEEPRWAGAVSYFAAQGCDFGFLPPIGPNSLAVQLRAAGPLERLAACYAWQLIEEKRRMKSPLSEHPWPLRSVGRALGQIELLAFKKWRLSQQPEPLTLAALKVVRPAWLKAFRRAHPALLNGRDLKRLNVGERLRGSILDEALNLVLEGRLATRRQALVWLKGRIKA